MILHINGKLDLQQKKQMHNRISNHSFFHFGAKFKCFAILIESNQIREKLDEFLPESVSSSEIISSFSSIPTDMAAAKLHLLELLMRIDVVLSMIFSKVFNFSKHVFPWVMIPKGTLNFFSLWFSLLVQLSLLLVMMSLYD